MSNFKNMAAINVFDSPVLKAAENAGAIFAKADETANRFGNIMTTLGTNNFENEVNHRPASQQWAVCTP